VELNLAEGRKKEENAQAAAAEEIKQMNKEARKRDIHQVGKFITAR
jgi:hypothetical protein